MTGPLQLLLPLSVLVSAAGGSAECLERPFLGRCCTQDESVPDSRKKCLRWGMKWNLCINMTGTWRPYTTDEDLSSDHLKSKEGPNSAHPYTQWTMGNSFSTFHAFTKWIRRLPLVQHPGSSGLGCTLLTISVVPLAVLGVKPTTFWSWGDSLKHTVVIHNIKVAGNYAIHVSPFLFEYYTIHINSHSNQSCCK